MSEQTQEKAPLRVEVVGGQLVISIGTSTLAAAFQESDYASPYDAETSDWDARFKVTDEAAFAREVARALQREREDGWTITHGLLDKACQKAVEDGAEGVRHSMRGGWR